MFLMKLLAYKKYENLILPALLNRYFKIYGKGNECDPNNQLVYAFNNHLTG